MVNKTWSSSQDLVFRLGLLEDAFIIYETPPKNCHDLVISLPIWNNLPITFFQKKVFVPLREAFLEKILPSLGTMYTDYFETIVHNYNKNKYLDS